MLGPLRRSFTGALVGVNITEIGSKNDTITRDEIGRVNQTEARA